MYLPITLSLTIPIGAVLGTLYDRWAGRRGGDVAGRRRTGILLATGLIVGESLLGVVYAGVVAASGRDDALDVVAPLVGLASDQNRDAVAHAFELGSTGVGVVVFALAIALLYRWTMRRADQRAAEVDAAD